MNNSKDDVTEICRQVRKKQEKRLKHENKLRIFLAVGMMVILAGIIVAGILIHNHSNNVKNASTSVKKTSSGKIDKKKEKETEKETEPSIFGKVKHPQKSEDYTEITSPDVNSKYVALLDVNNNKIIAGKQFDTRINPASMTKVMTLIVAVENIKDLNSTFTFTTELIDPLVQQQASRAGFEPGEVITAKDMLYGLILPSGADAAVGLSTMIAGSEPAFVDLMNKKCEEIGLKNTHFMNSSGLYDPNHYTTPEEMAMILEYAMTNPDCAQVLSTYQYTTQVTAQHPQGLVLSSTMFSRMYGNEVTGVKIAAGKTGYTVEAGNCLVSYAQRNDEKYIAAAAGAEHKWNVIYDDFQIYGNYIPNAPGYVKAQ